MAWEFKVTNGPEAGKCEAIQDPAQHPCDFFYPSLSLSLLWKPFLLIQFLSQLIIAWAFVFLWLFFPDDSPVPSHSIPSGLPSRRLLLKGSHKKEVIIGRNWLLCRAQEKRKHFVAFIISPLSPPDQHHHPSVWGGIQLDHGEVIINLNTCPSTYLPHGLERMTVYEIKCWHYFLWDVNFGTIADDCVSKFLLKHGPLFYRTPTFW